MTAIDTCDAIAEHAEAYLEGTLPDAEATAVEIHLSGCEACRQRVQSYREVHSLMEYSQIEEAAAQTLPSAPAAAKQNAFARLSAAPWWFVSVSLHTLVIALAGLVSMAVEAPRSDDSVIMITELQSRAVQPQPETEKKRLDVAEVMNKEIPPTDVNSPNNSDILVPKDVLALAELGDHFETVNPELADTHGALSTPDAQSFHDIRGAGGLGMDELIGFGGAASKGSGGGFGGGDGTGTGLGTGAGKGSFGHRTGAGRKAMVAAHGGSKATEGVVEKGLQWLAYHQEADGHWDARKYESVCDFGGVGASQSADDIDIACTGFSLLAFLGAGHTEKVGQYKDNVTRGIKWLISKQSPDGKLTGFGYAHAIAGMALCEAAGMAKIPETKEAAQGAINYSVVMQQGDGSEKFGWTYIKCNNGPDMSNSGWHVMLLKDGKVAGLKVDTLALQGAISYLDACQVKDGSDPYGHRYQYYPVKLGFPGVTKTRTAIALLCRLYTGTPVHEMEDAARWLISDKKLDQPCPPPAAGDVDWSVDLYSWYYKTLVLFQVGGDSWKEWNEKLKEAVLLRQDADGSFKPLGEGSKKWGRVGQTALNILCMEVYYRYHMLGGDRK